MSRIQSVLVSPCPFVSVQTRPRSPASLFWTYVSHPRTNVILSARQTTYQTLRPVSWKVLETLSCGSNWLSNTSTRTTCKSANDPEFLSSGSGFVCGVDSGCFVCRSAAECLEAALNTLSRALETNCDNPEVWNHYLCLFSRRGSREEVQEMCEMAVEHAPDYHVWWNVSPVQL